MSELYWKKEYLKTNKRWLRIERDSDVMGLGEDKAAWVGEGNRTLNSLDDCSKFY